MLICDEPTSALDPIGRKEILDILSAIKTKTTVLFSTHILSDVEKICDHVAILHHGQLVLNGSLAELKRSRRQERILVQLANAADFEKIRQDPRLGAFHPKVDETDYSLTLETQEIAAAQKTIYQALADLQVYPAKIEVAEPTLESLFLEAVR